MAAESVVRQLRNILAQLYPSVADATRVGQDAAIKIERVALTGSALNMWDALLREAIHSQQLSALLTVVYEEYPTHPELGVAIITYEESVQHQEPLAEGAVNVITCATVMSQTLGTPPVLQQQGLAWLQPFLNIEQVEQLTHCLVEFAKGTPDAKRLRETAERVAELEKRFMVHKPAPPIGEALRGRVLLCSVGFRPLPVILSTLMIQPTKLYLLHSSDSRPHAEAVRDDAALQVIQHLAIKDIHLREMSLTDAPQNYSLLQKIINENPGKEFVVDISGGVKVMGTSLAAAAFWQRIPVVYQLGEEVAGTIKPFSEQLIQVENPFAYFGSAELRSISELFGHAEYDAALAVCRNLTDTTGDPGTLGTLQILTEFIHIYRDWDAFVHSQPTDDATRKLATRLGKVAQHMQRLRLNFVESTQVGRNLDFLAQIERSWQPGQRNQVDPYRLVDIFASAQRRAATGKYDDAVARLYRCLEMSASLCLLNECQLGDTKTPVFDYFVHRFGSLDMLHAEFAKLARYPMPTARLGLQDQMILLGLSGQASHKTIAGIYRGMERANLLEMRNRSILAHGTVAVEQAAYAQFEKQSAAIISHVLGDKPQLAEMLQQATHPRLTIAL